MDMEQIELPIPTYKANIKIISIYLDTYKTIEGIYGT